MQSSTKLITAPASELITTTNAKLHLKVSGSSEDTYIDSLVEVATKMVEEYTGRALITQTWEQYFDDLPQYQDYVELHKGPVQSITSFKYFLNDTESTFNSAKYNLDDAAIFPRVYLDDDETWPNLDVRRNAVTIRFVAGYGDAATDVPEPLIQAVRMLIGYLYQNREDRIGRSPFKTAALPQAVSYLCQPYRLWRF